MSDVPPAQPVNPDIYALFCGVIDQSAVQRVFNAFAIASTNRVPRIHLLFQSSGGSVADGVCLYNFFRTATIELVLYNVGSVQSIATIAYLGAQRRKTSARATFLIHRTSAGSHLATAAGLKGLTEGVVLDDQRTESILRDHLKLVPERWSDLNLSNLYFSGEEAIQVGIADEIGEFAPPKGAQIYNIV